MDSLPSQTFRTHRPLLWSIAALVVCFILWASFCEIEEQIHAPGRIIPAAQTKTIQHLEGGIIEDILVKEGSYVEKDQPLVKIRNPKAQSEKDELKISIESFKIRRARLKQELEGASEFSYESKIPTELQETLANEISTFTGNNTLHREKISGLEQQIEQKKLKLQNMKSQLSSLSAEKKVAQDQLNINERLKKSGAISESRYLDSVGAVKNFDTRIDQIRTSIPVIESEAREIQKNIEIENGDRRSLIQEEMNDVELNINQASERMKTSTDEVTRAEVLSPVKGIVNKLNLNTIGGVVRPGEALAEITPFDDNLVVEARVNTKDRGKIWIGLPASVKITAYDYAIFGGVKGKITEISPDSLEDEKGVSYYRVRTVLESNTLGDKPLYPGMTVDGNIIAGRLSVMRALLQPVFRVQENALR